MTAIATHITATSTDPPWNRLGRPTLGVAAAPVPAAVLSGVTFGLLPAVLWPWRWSALVDRDRAYYRDLASWWQGRVNPVDGAELGRIVDQLRPRPILVVLPWLAAAFTIASAVVMLLIRHPDLHGLVERLGDGTYRYGALRHTWLASAMDQRVHDVWLWGLMFAYGCHFYAVRTHARVVGDLVRWTNRVARAGNYRKVRNETRRLGIGPFWIAAAVILCCNNAWWAIPMVLAGAAQRRYADVATPRLQQALSAQAGDAMSKSRATPRSIAAPVARFCPTTNCGHRVPATAAFCPRCGGRTVTADVRYPQV